MKVSGELLRIIAYAFVLGAIVWGWIVATLIGLAT